MEMQKILKTVKIFKILNKLNLMFLLRHSIQFLASQNLQQIYVHLRRTSNSSISSEILELPIEVSTFAIFLHNFNLKHFLKNIPLIIIIDTATDFRYFINVLYNMIC